MTAWLDEQAVHAAQRLAAVDPALLTPAGRAVQAVAVDTAFDAIVAADAAPCRECRDGKCSNCDGWALDPDTDQMTDCGCAARGHA